jgi:hypothetical protein
MFQTKAVEKIKTHFIFNHVFFFPKIVPLMSERGKNAVERDRPQMAIWRTSIACWIPKATHTHTHTHSGYVKLNDFPQWLHEHVSMLRYTYVACLVLVCCVGSGLWDELIIRSEESCGVHARARVCVCAWILEPQQGGLVPIWAAVPKKTNWSYSIKIASSKYPMKLRWGLNIQTKTTPQTMASKYLQLKQNDVLVDDSSKSSPPTTTLEQISPLLKGTSIIWRQNTTSWSAVTLTNSPCKGVLKDS